MRRIRSGSKQRHRDDLSGLRSFKDDAVEPEQPFTEIVSRSTPIERERGERGTLTCSGARQCQSAFSICPVVEHRRRSFAWVEEMTDGLDLQMCRSQLRQLLRNICQTHTRSSNLTRGGESAAWREERKQDVSDGICLGEGTYHLRRPLVAPLSARGIVDTAGRGVCRARDSVNMGRFQE